MTIRGIPNNKNNVGLEKNLFIFRTKLIRNPAFIFFILAPNDRGFEHLAVCGSIRCRTAKNNAGAKLPEYTSASQ
jgi:hypothetical protein